MRLPRVSYAFLFLLVLSCTPNKREAVPEFDYTAANFSGLLQDTASQLLTSADQAGGLAQAKQRKVEWKGLRVSVEEGAVLLVRSSAKLPSYLQLAPGSAGLPGDWSDHEKLLIEYEWEANDKPSAELRLHGTHGYLPLALRPGDGLLRDTLSLSELPVVNNQADLHQDQSFFSLVFIKLVWKTGTGSLKIKSLALLKRNSPRRALVDKFGQRTTTFWPGKVNYVGEMKRKLEKEKQSFTYSAPAEMRVPAGLPQFSTGNYFRTKKDDKGRWWLVRPNGKVFWSVGITGIRPSKANQGATRTAGREWLFEELPAPDGQFAAAYPSKGYLSFYALNCLKKYGNYDHWKAHTLHRLKQWGINTIGCWPHPMMQNQEDLPFVATIEVRGKFGADERLFGQIANPLLPDFSDRVRQAVETGTEGLVNRKNLLGYFVDNENRWNALVERDYNEDAYFKKIYFAFLKRRGKLADSLSKAERVAFAAHLAHKYFGVVNKHLRASDPNHLWLGCRFLRALPPQAVVNALAAYADVISVNMYSYEPDLEAIEAVSLSGKPLLIGEHHVPLATNKTLPPPYQTFSPEERKRYYINFYRKAAQSPTVVGAHWYQWADQDLMGRATDGENQCWGFVDIVDNPYADLKQGLRQVNDSLLFWRTK